MVPSIGTMFLRAISAYRSYVRSAMRALMSLSQRSRKAATVSLLASTELPHVRLWHEAYGHKADMGGSGWLPCKLIPEPHYSDRKCLL
jgi:hypothetical protein